MRSSRRTWYFFLGAAGLVEEGAALELVELGAGGSATVVGASVLVPVLVLDVVVVVVLVLDVPGAVAAPAWSAAEDCAKSAMRLINGPASSRWSCVGSTSLAYKNIMRARYFLTSRCASCSSGEALASTCARSNNLAHAARGASAMWHSVERASERRRVPQGSRRRGV